MILAIPSMGKQSNNRTNVVISFEKLGFTEVGSWIMVGAMVVSLSFCTNVVCVFRRKLGINKSEFCVV